MKPPSDSTLMAWWRKAVKAVHGDRCILCGKTPVECHHIIKRRKALLRYDWRNGVPLCAECHAEADTIAGRNHIGQYVDVEYLSHNENRVLKDHLTEYAKSRTEFLTDELDELKAVCANPALYRKWLS